jgi:hypothetical protein
MDASITDRVIDMDKPFGLPVWASVPMLNGWLLGMRINNPAAEMVCACQETHPGGSGVGQTRKVSTKDNAKSKRIMVHSDQASHVAVW